jgi:hypothetical protein
MFTNIINEISKKFLDEWYIKKYNKCSICNVKSYCTYIFCNKCTNNLKRIYENSDIKNNDINILNNFCNKIYWGNYETFDDYCAFTGVFFHVLSKLFESKDTRFKDCDGKHYMLNCIISLESLYIKENITYLIIKTTKGDIEILYTGNNFHNISSDTEMSVDIIKCEFI